MDRMRKENNFSVESQGHCFLCLNKIPSRFPPVKLDGTRDISPSSVHSMHDISRYLKLDMRKVFIQGGPIPPHLLAKVERSRLKVELCEECAAVTENISKQCRQLEKLKLEIESGFELIHGKLADADKSGKTAQFRRAAGFELDPGMGGWMEILEVLRLETMQKCKKPINKSSPRLHIPRITTREIRKRTSRISKTGEETHSERMPALGSQRSSIKMEGDKANWELEDDDRSEISLVDDMDAQAEGSISTAMENEGESKQGRLNNFKVVQTWETKTRDNPERNYTINSETGKYKCRLCPMEYATRTGVGYHHKSVHCKVRFKCKLCGKEFTQQSKHKIHHQNFHMGIRFKCPVCKKVFTQKNNLMTHQRQAGCSTAMKSKVN